MISFTCAAAAFVEAEKWGGRNEAAALSRAFAVVHGS